MALPFELVDLTDTSPLELVERDAELNHLDCLVRDCADGRGGVVLVAGGVATGKTELLYAFAERAAERAVVLTATGSRVERTLPLGVVSQLFHSVAVPAGVWERVTGLLEEGMFTAALSDPESETVEHVRANVVNGLCSALVEVAGGRPLVIVVDDLQYVDVPSLQLLLFLVRRVRTARVGVVLAEGVGPVQARPLFHGELTRQARFRRVQVAPLTEAGVERLLSGRIDTGLAGAVHRISGGNPLLVRALVEDHENATTHPAGRPAVGKTFGRAVVSCLRRGDPVLLEVARGLAVTGPDTPVTVLSQLLDVETDTVANALEVLAWSGILTADGEFRHEQAVAAVVEDMPARVLADLHHRVAGLLHDRGEPAAAVARHLVAAGRADDPWGVQVLREAAEQALVADQVQPAVDCLELTTKVCADGPQRASITTQLSGLEWRLNPASGARHLNRLTAAMRAGHLAGADASTLVRNLLWHGRMDDAGDMLELLDGAEEQHITALWLSASYPTLRNRVPPIEPHAQLAPAVCSDPRLQAALALTTVLTHGATEEAISGAEQVLQSTRLDATTLEPLKCALLALIYADRLDKAAPWCDLLLQEAAARRAPGWQAPFAAIRAEICIRQGDLPQAERHARAALDHMSPQAWGVAIGVPLATLLMATTAMGKLEDTAALFTQPVPPAMLQTRHGLHYLHARGHYHLATNRLHAALGDFLYCGELMRAWDLDLPALVPWRTSAAEVYLRLGKRDQARDLVEEQLGMLAAGPSRSRGISLRLKAATSEEPHRPALLKDAVDQLQAAGDRLELARALADLSTVHQALGEPSRARMAARRAWHVAKGCRAETLLPNWNTEELPTPVEQAEVADAEAITALSEAERRVAALAAVGHTNREIAGKLYITVSTVEQHLTRVYRKLNVNRRKDLPAGLQLTIANSA
ncbi:AAA family ATPase [Kutzneria viridogrisea]|uniref:AAA family ATPase n=3 Tax=Kutzneria viridogrisea TaxID=47990 RepID=UPI00296F1B51